jgi:hypothetical protein
MDATALGERSTLQNSYIADATDALLVIIAVHTARLHLVPARLSYVARRELICSGAVFVWRTSVIRRWTDDIQWTASHSLDSKLLVSEPSTAQLHPLTSLLLRYIISDWMFLALSVSALKQVQSKTSLQPPCARMQHCTEDGELILV